MNLRFVLVVLLVLVLDWVVSFDDEDGAGVCPRPCQFPPGRG